MFSANETETKKLLDNGNAIFLKYWNINEEKSLNKYKKSLIPGSIDSLSGSSIGGSNMGINTFISKEKKGAAAEVIQFITSVDVQRKFVKEGLIYSGIDNIYLEEEIYSNLKAKFSIDVQFISRPIFESLDYDRFSKNYRKYIYQYIYGNETYDEMAEKIRDLTSIYTVSLDTKYTNAGVTLFVIVIVLTCLLFLSMSFPYIYRLKPYLSIFSNGSWLLFVLGSIILLDSGLMVFGEMTLGKCNLRSILIFIGFYFNFTPIMNKYMLMYPKNNKLFFWICKHKGLFYMCLFLIGVGIQLFGLVTPYHIEISEPENDKRFLKCVIREGFIPHVFNNISWILIFIVILATLSIVILDFVMIPLGPCRVNFVITSSIISIVSIILYLTLKEPTNYVNYVVYQISFHIIFSLSNYLIFYIFRLIYLLVLKKFGILDNNKYEIKSQRNSANDASSFDENKPKLNIEQRILTKKNMRSNSVSIINTFATESISICE